MENLDQGLFECRKPADLEKCQSRFSFLLVVCSLLLPPPPQPLLLNRRFLALRATATFRAKKRWIPRRVISPILIIQSFALPPLMRSANTTVPSSPSNRQPVAFSPS